jgi:hypothetical protein
MSACAEYDSFASLPLPLAGELGVGSVVDSCVSLLRFSGTPRGLLNFA